jgi:hypothetical protein
MGNFKKVNCMKGKGKKPPVKPCATFVALVLGLCSFAVSADNFGNSPSVPKLYTDGLTRLQVPNLTKPERAIFSAYEAIQQVGEAYVQANGCPVSPLKGSVDAFSDQNGTGDVTVVTAGGELKVDVTRVAFDSFRGDTWRVKAASGKLAKTNFTGLLGTYTFNRSGSIMTGDALVSVPNPQASGVADLFTARVIKDFYIYKAPYQDVVRDFTLDWGLQVILKKGYPASKYWQRSWSLKDDGIEGKTVFQKIRIAGGSTCKITIHTSGFNNPEEFNEQGSFSIEQATGIRTGL